MDRKIDEAERAKPPLESILKLARKLNSGERLLAAKDAANLPRLSTSWLARMAGNDCQARPIRSLWRSRGRCLGISSAHKLRTPYSSGGSAHEN